MKNILLIVDPQNDFITGSLSVEGAEEKMSKLGKYLDEKNNKYDAVYVTLDSHPNNHCSFKENGGIWDKHCIILTYGESISNLISYKYITDTFHKGDSSTKEEYSIFDNKKDGLRLSEKIKFFIEGDKDTFIDVCGIAGDYCVLETLKGLTEIINNKNIFILEEFTASIDGGKKLLDYAEKNNINVIFDTKDNLEKYLPKFNK